MLGELQPRCAVVYIDDITIFSPSLCQHLIYLGEVFKRLTAMNLKLNLEKYNFVKTEVKVLGHLHQNKEYNRIQRRVKVYKKLEPPKDVTGVKSFLGVRNYFRKFIPQCSVLAKPLLLLTRGCQNSRNRFCWGEDQQTSFEALKACLITSPILKFPNSNKKFYNEKDASTVGMGAMLSQAHGADRISDRFPVAYASRSLNKAERNYGITDLEGLAVSWAISYFETYIHGMNFTIIKDHSALKALKDKSLLTGRLLRRAEKLLEYDFDVIYQSGKEHVVPDFHSRLYLVEMSTAGRVEDD